MKLDTTINIAEQYFICDEEWRKKEVISSAIEKKMEKNTSLKTLFYFLK